MIENAVAVSLFGMLLGPMYPIVMNHAGKILPRKQLTRSVGQLKPYTLMQGDVVVLILEA
jgi:hypothetical protein